MRVHVQIPACILNLYSVQAFGVSYFTSKNHCCYLSRAKTAAQKKRSSWSATIHSHLKNNRVDEARRMFDKMSSPDMYLYTRLINGYFQVCEIEKAVQLFNNMPSRDVVSWNSMIKGCLSCGNFDLAWKLFNEMPKRNVISWTTMIDGLAQSGQIGIAEEMFYTMEERDTAAWNSMIHGYCCNGKMKDAYHLFKEMPQPNVISWTTVIGGFDQNGESDRSLSLFCKMRVLGVEPTPNTFACVLTACTNILALTVGVQLHTLIIKSGIIFDAFIATSLVTLYSNCKQIENSHRIFEENVHRDVALWTALITGYGLNTRHESALSVFHNMLINGIKPNQSTLTSTLNSCCGLEALDRGKEIHTIAIKVGLDHDAFVGNSLLVMYTRCGNIDDGVNVFNTISKKNIVSWNCVIVGCATHGYGLHALEFFERMKLFGVQPDEITFVGLLTACSHSRMIETGKQFFEMIGQDPLIELKHEHCVCMVDILGRSGKLEEAEEFIKNLPIEANAMIWLSLLGACRVHSNLEVAERAATKIFHLEPHCGAAYVLLSNIYASCGSWDDVSRIRRMMKGKGIKKIPGSSWIVLKGFKHEFLSGDRSHPMSKEIYEELDLLGGKSKELGYVSDKSFALHNVEDEQKEIMLSYHSERLAIAFGLILTVKGSTITVLKNLRVCGDCHSAIKLMSVIVGRELIIRDSSRFHHFRNGTCSCGDYW
ncbi:pentatricopeptide repeat-containing protein At5g46460, mitochondrial [Aristolochia californica]|uniref:pentatricopeptide repeat-containing protein At5g46460, mitochondrial n=1 Tax=Aristolochia californica TaxID=171875 RepID=UPI0035DB95D0